MWCDVIENWVLTVSVDDEAEKKKLKKICIVSVLNWICGTCGHVWLYLFLLTAW